MNPFIINLSLACFWAFLAAGIFTAEFINGPLGWRPFGVSAGWFAAVLAVFNSVRVFGIWWFRRQNAQCAASPSESELLRRQFHLDEPRKPESPPDPNFQFTDEPPRPER
ncbi:MAG: hypothetical protein JNM56_14475 [Planctomycetia bacterium]|nr:hypothetical protein [Planctomycetia bacterium]